MDGLTGQVDLNVSASVTRELLSTPRSQLMDVISYDTKFLKGNP